MKPIKLILALVIIFSMHSLRCYSQETSYEVSTDRKTYSQQFDDQFSIDPEQVPTGYLYDRVFPTADLENLNPCDTVTAIKVTQAWWEMENSDLNPERQFTYSATRILLRNTLLKPNLPIIGLDFRASAFDERAFEDGRLILEDDRYYIAENENPFNQIRAQMVAFGRDEVETETEYSIYIDPAFFVQNTGTSILEARLKRYPDNEVIRLLPGIVLPIHFEAEEDATFEIQLELSDGSSVCDKIVLHVVKKRYKKKAQCDDGELLIIESDIPFKGLMETKATTSIGNAHIYYHKTPELPCKVIKPIIITDGFDPLDTRSAKNLYKAVKYEGPGVNSNLIMDLQFKGYDVIILNFPIIGSEAIQYRSGVKQFKNDGTFDTYVDREGRDGGADYIQRNAFITVKLIQEINQMLKTNGSDEELVVLGPSMGGLVTRYALAYMEKQESEGVANMDHNTRLWVSFDSPQDGANIPMSTQFMIDFFGYYKGDQTVVDMFRQQLRSIAARQQLLQSYDAIWSGEDFKTRKHHTSFFSELRTNGLTGSTGWPQNLRKISLSNGALNGNFNFEALTYDIQIDVDHEFPAGIWFQAFNAGLKYGPNPGEQGMVFEGKFWIKKSFILHQTEVSYYNSNLNGNMDIVQGGHYPDVNIISDLLLESVKSEANAKDVINVKHTGSNFTFIPTISSLGFKDPDIAWDKDLADVNLVCAGLTHFDNYFVPEKNEFHVRVTPANAKWILQEIERGQPGCDKMCADADGWPTLLCKGTTTDLNLKDLPQNTSYSIDWTLDNSFTLNNGQSTAKATIEATVSNQLNPFRRVTATIIPTCAADHVITKYIEIPNTRLSIEGNDKICAFQEQYESVSASIGLDHFWYYGDIHGTYKTNNPYSTISPPTNYTGPDPDKKRFTDFGGSRLGNYTLYVEAENVCGESMTGLLSVAIVPKSTCTGTLKGFNEFEPGKVVVYPNPTADHWTLYLTNPNDKIGEVRVYTMSGQLLKIIVNEQDRSIIDLNGDLLPHGLYILKLRTISGESITHRLVKRPAG